MYARTLALTVSAAVLFSCSVPVAAAEMAAPSDYIANIRQHVGFLEQASELATAKAQDAKVKAFAVAEAAAQQSALKSLQSWDVGQPTGGLTTPMVVAANQADLTDTAQVITGRSVAVEQGDSEGVLMASPGVIVLPQLSQRQGTAFDALYKATQAESLRELQGLYEAYSMTGKDPALRALALRELPSVKQRISDLAGL